MDRVNFRNRVRIILILAVLALILFALPNATVAGDIILFGPNKYTRTTCKQKFKHPVFNIDGDRDIGRYFRRKYSWPNVYTDRFRGTPGTGTLILRNGDGGKDRVRSAAVFLNGRRILGPKDLNQQLDLIEIPVSNLSIENTIWIILKGKPGGFFTLSVLGNTIAKSVLEAVQAMEEMAGTSLEIHYSPITRLVTLVDTQTEQPIPLPGMEGASAQEISLAFLDSYGAAFAISDISQIEVTRVQGPDEIGMSHVRLQQVHNGIPIRAGELIIHVREANVVTAQAKTLPRLQDIDTDPSLPSADALDAARGFLYEELGVTDAALSTPSLEIFNLGLLSGGRTPTELAWFIEANKPAFHEFIWVDAHTGDILQHFNVLAEAVIPQIYDYTDPLNPKLITNFPSGDVSADRAYDYAGDTYNYFLNAHNRDSWDGAGAPLIVNVHYPNTGQCSYATAFWGPDRVFYCENQIVTDDVIGHEITHGVSQAAANLYSSRSESGALNEGYAYIFGETVDQVNGRDAGPNVPWWWAEDMSGKPLVDMMNPADSGKAGKVSDPQIVCHSGTDPEHNNAWVLAHAYALMADGGTFNDITVAGIGLDKAAKIHYKALTDSLGQGSNFSDNYYVLKRSCLNLIGFDGITFEDCTEVIKALDAVEMSIPLCPDFILTANEQHTIDVHLSRGDGTFYPPVSVGEDLGVNYTEFAVWDSNYFIAATDENPARLFLFERTGRTSFVQKFVKTLDSDPKAAPDYGLGLTVGFHPSIAADYFLENINVGFTLPDESTGYWIARGNFNLCTHGRSQCDRTLSQSANAFDFSNIFTGWTLSKSSNLADVDGDGFQDMLVSEQSSGGAASSKVYLLRGDRDTSQTPYRYFFHSPVHVFTTSNHPATHITLGDFNNNGTVDAIVGQDDDGDPGAAFLYLGNGDGSFEIPGREVFDVQPGIESGNDQPGSGNFQAYDADGDGILDIISAYKKKRIDDPDEGSRLVFLRGRGNGNFEEPVTISENIIFRSAYATPTTRPEDIYLPGGP